MRLSLPVFLFLAAAAQAEPGLKGLAYVPDPAVRSIAKVRELRCAACHEDDLKLGLEIPPAPNLKGVGARFHPDWIRRFVNDPHGTEPGTRMPSTLHHLKPEEREPAVENLVHYLSSLKGPAPKSRGYRHPVSTVRGRKTYERIGCAACHGKVSPKLEKKWRVFHLIDFLQAPLHLRPDGRMPDLMVTEHEAADLAVHLLSLDETNLKALKPPPHPTFDPKRATKGRHLFRTLGCVNCHDGEDQPLLKGPPISRVWNGKACTSATYGDRPPERLEDPRAIKPDQHARALTAGLQCNACHSRAGTDGWIATQDELYTGDEGLAEAGRKPPTLNAVGRKLHQDWLEGIVGSKANRLRPYIETRMPVFGPKVAKRIGDAFMQADVPAAENPLTIESVEAGRKLVGVGGMNCTTCHHLGDWKSLGIPAINIAKLDRRLRPAWFREYMLAPSDYRPGTLMPGFWPKGVSTNPHILGGNTEKQLSAIWTYLKKPDKQPDGYPPPKGEFEIVPDKAPVVMRSFSQSTGPHSLVIGMPGGFNLVFNTKDCRFSEWWKGKFIDGYNTYFSRRSPTFKPLGTDHWILKDDPLGPGKKAWYKGYEINGQTVRIRTDAGDYDISVHDGRLRLSLSNASGIKKRIAGHAKPDRFSVVRETPLTVEVTW